MLYQANKAKAEAGDAKDEYAMAEGESTKMQVVKAL